MKNVRISIALLPCLVLLLLSSCHSSRETYRIPTYTKSRSKAKQNTSVVKAYPKKESKNHDSSSAGDISNAIRAEIAEDAKKYIGTPYVYGGKKPSSGFDCSGLLTYVFSSNGFPLSGSSRQLAKQGKKIADKEIKQGDLVFFGSNGKVSHCAIVLESDYDELYVIHSTSKKGVRIDEIYGSSYWSDKYLYARRILQ